jgi:hypothetical protein
VLPDLGSLTASVGTDGADDVVCDLAREVMPLGVAGVVVVDSTGRGTAAVRRVVRLAGNFECPVILLHGEPEVTVGDSWRVERADAPGTVSLSASSPTGVLLTPGDVSDTWTLAEVAAFGRRRD